MNLNYLEKEIFVLTGATGWVGRNFLHVLQKIFPPESFNENVLAFGSKRTEINSTAYLERQIKIPIYPLEIMNAILKNQDNLKIIHTAFLTREKIQNYGIENYIKINKKITSSVEELLDSSRNSQIVIISSGAAKLFDNNDRNKNKLIEFPYEYLKYEEEEILSSKSNSLVLRIFALSGRFIKDPNLFAIGNFLVSANFGNPIIIKSKNNVIRSYGFAADIANLAVSWLNDKKRKKLSINKINAASLTLNLIELARCITNIYSLPEVNENVDFKLEENNYSCETHEFLDLLKSYDIKPTELGLQIKETMKDIT